MVVKERLGGKGCMTSVAGEGFVVVFEVVAVCNVSVSSCDRKDRGGKAKVPEFGK